MGNLVLRLTYIDFCCSDGGKDDWSWWVANVWISIVVSLEKINLICNMNLIIFTNLSAWAGCDIGSFFKQSLTGLNSEFSFLTSCLTKAEEPSLPYYLPIAGGRIIGFKPFPRVLVLCEMLSYYIILIWYFFDFFFLWKYSWGPQSLKPKGLGSFSNSVWST